MRREIAPDLAAGRRPATRACRDRRRPRSAAGRICRSVSANMNRPLCVAPSARAGSRARPARCGSAVDAITKSTGKLPPPGSGGGTSGDDADARDLRQRPIEPRSAAAACVFVRSLHGLVTMPPKPPVGERDLEDAVVLGHRLIDVVDLRGEELRLIERRVGRRLDDAEDERPGPRSAPAPSARTCRTGTISSDDDRPTRVRRPAGTFRRRRERARVAAPHAVEAAVDPAGEARSVSPARRSFDAHHRRQRQRHDAGDEDRAGQRERELAEERAGQAALDADRARRPPPA